MLWTTLERRNSCKHACNSDQFKAAHLGNFAATKPVKPDSPTAPRQKIIAHGQGCRYRLLVENPRVILGNAEKQHGLQKPIRRITRPYRNGGEVCFGPKCQKTLPKTAT